MDQQNKAKLFTFLYVFLIIAVVLFMVWMVFWLKGDGKECVKDPINYFESKLEGSQCTCYDKNFKEIIIGGEDDREIQTDNSKS